jgi:hypothetical protein
MSVSVREFIETPRAASSSTNDPEPVDGVDPNPDESSNNEEPPEPGDIDRESR